MTFTQAISSCLSKYATFSGRAPRSEFWWFWLFAQIAVVAMFFVFGLIGYAFGDVAGFFVAAYVGGGLTQLLLFLPSLSVLVRRLHDGGHSGWCYFLPLIPLIGGIWLFVYLLQGSDEENQYGLPLC